MGLSPLSVTWHPGPDESGSPYISTQANCLRRFGIEVKRLGLRSLLTSQVVHIHWPEHLVRGSSRSRRMLSPLFVALVMAGLKRPRAPALVWTIHNLAPHTSPTNAAEQWLERVFNAFLIKRVDVVLILVDSQRRTILETYAFPAGTPLIHVPEGIEHRAIPDHGNPRDSINLVSIGSISPYKGFVYLAEQFSSIEDHEATLHIVGHPDSRDEVELLAHHQERGHISLDPRRIPDHEMERVLEQCDAVVVAHQGQFNSGSPWTALGANRPVIIVESDLATELRNAVGSDWIFVLPVDFGVAAIREAIAWVDRAREPLDVEQFEWSTVTGQLVEAYDAAVSRRVAKPKTFRSR